ncbi:MAG: hypothetical protein AB2693_15635 [Candidatus Thiodiazotropha sp.]
MNEKASNLYIPDYRAWENFYEKRAKKEQTVGFGFETESEALKQQQQEIFVNTERIKVCEQKQTEPKIINVVSPTEQTVQQATSAMKQTRLKVKPKKKATGSRSKKTKNQQKKKKSQGKKSAFSYRTLKDIFSKRR